MDRGSSQRLPAGRHVVTWDGRTRSGLRAAAGVYFIEMRAGTWREHRKAILLR